MSTYYEPGWYLATVDGVPDQRVSRTADGRWLDINGSQGVVRSPSPDFRPAIVLDPNDTDVRFIAALSVHPEPFVISPSLRRLAERIAAQMPEPKPERIPEPGLWGVVKARRFPRDTAGEYAHCANDVWPWMSLTPGGAAYGWDQLIDPVLVRPGLGDPQ